MNGDRTTQALARIEAALARLEAASGEVAGHRRSAAELARLQARHHKLREAVNDGLQQLDLLIETAQG